MENTLVFNEKQQEVIDNYNNNILVLAPAGTGKTRVIVEVIKKHLESGLDPKSIIALTFTNKAASELKERVKNRFPNVELQVSTFHSFCYNFVCQHIDLLGLVDKPIICSPDDTLEIVQDFLNTLYPEYASLDTYAAKVVGIYTKASITNDKDGCYKCVYKALHNNEINNKFASKTFLNSKFLVGLIAYYQQRLQRIGAVCFDDIIRYTLQLLKENASISEIFQEQIKFLVIDEYQDTSAEELEILSYFHSKDTCIHCYGDVNQAIYAWRGSDLKLAIETFKKWRPMYLEIHFNECYRSTQALLNYYNYYQDSLLTNCSVKTMTHNGEGTKPIFVSSTSRDSLINTLKATVDSQSGSTAILVRSNKDVEALKKLLDNGKRNIITADLMQILKTKEARIITNILRLVDNPYNDTAYRFLINLLAPINSDLPKQINNISRTTRLPINVLFNSPLYTYFNQSLEQGKVAVVDIETTNVDESGEIVQIAAIIVNKSQILKSFTVYIKVKDVGSSVDVHHITNEYLSEHGIPLKEALLQFKQFLEENQITYTVGHNYHFDVNKINQYAKQELGSHILNPDNTLDTLALSRYIFPKEKSYKLEDLARLVKATHSPTHNAYDDVIATYYLLQRCYPIPNQNTYAILQDPSIQEIATVIKTIISSIYKATNMYTGLLIAIEYLIKNIYLIDTLTSKTMDNFLEYIRMYQIFSKSNNTLQIVSSFLTYAALHASELVNLSSDINDHPIYILTTHTAKGLEFDNVHFYQVAKNVFPSYFAERGIAKMEEEYKLFYVAVTRAKQNLHIYIDTSSSNNFQGSLKPAISKGLVNVLDTTASPKW